MGETDELGRLRRDYADQTDAAGKWIARAKALEMKLVEREGYIKLLEAARQPSPEVERLKTQVTELEDALLFYADPDSYFAIGFLPDRPCGEFIDDFDKNYSSPNGMDYDRPMPGKHARETLRKFYPSEETRPATVPTGISSPEAAGFDSQAGRQSTGGYVVIYDVDEGETETYYGYFSSPEEARRMFHDAYPDQAVVTNARLVQIIGDIDSEVP